MKLRSKTATHIKTVHYGSDGTGRDSYVLINNGGFEKEKPILKHPKQYPVNSGGARKYSNPYIPKTVHYFSDGTGKDSYIVTDEGGLSYAPAHKKKFNYILGLRNYERIPSCTSTKVDWFQNSQQSKKLVEIEKDNNLAKKQKLLTRKLSSIKQRS